MMDPDAPNRERPSKREWYHWSVLNISENNVADGDTVVKYVGPGPPAKSGNCFRRAGNSNLGEI